MWLLYLLFTIGASQAGKTYPLTVDNFISFTFHFLAIKISDSRQLSLCIYFALFLKANLETMKKLLGLGQTCVLGI